jgi:hypothetical protein
VADEKIISERIGLDGHFDRINQALKTDSEMEGGPDVEGATLSLKLLETRCLVEIAKSVLEIQATLERFTDRLTL